jgi:transcriptional regulator with PAS, ATPase and Fis domain
MILSKEIQMILDKNRKEWGKAFDAIDDWICIIDLNSTIQMTNRMVEKYFQIPVRDAIGCRCCMLAHGIIGRIEQCPLPRMIHTRKRETLEVRLKNNRWMMISVDPIINDQDELTGAVHITRDITRMVRIRCEMEQLVLDLKKTLNPVTALSSLLPICSNCKKIRDANGYWCLLESYIETHSKISFSHGLCPDCSDVLYGSEDWYIEMKQKKRKNRSLTPADQKPGQIDTG